MPAVLSDGELTGVDPEEAGGAAEVLPSESRILLEVTDEDIVECLRVVDGVEDVGICTQKHSGHTPAKKDMLMFVVVDDL